MKLNHWTYTRYKNAIELEGGQLLSIEFTKCEEDSSWHYEGEVEYSETEFYLDKKPCRREDLPAEVTTALIKKLEHDAKADFEHDFGGVD